MKTVSLFSGAGLMDLGAARAGLETVAAYEASEEAASLYQKVHGLAPTVGFLERGKLDHLPESCDVLIGGPPCQPFSNAGDNKGGQDPRDGFPVALDAVSRMRPRVVVLENVRGYLRPRFAAHRAYVVSTLESMGYHVRVWSINAADFGVPQSRRRCFVVARFDRDPGLAPAPTHSLGDLAYTKWADGSYWRARGLTPQGEPTRFERAALKRPRPGLAPHVTVWDALGQPVLGGGGNPSGAHDAGRRNRRELTHGPSTTIAAQHGGGAGNAGPWVVRYRNSRKDTDGQAHGPAATVGTKGTLYWERNADPSHLHRVSVSVSATEVKGPGARTLRGENRPDRASCQWHMGTGIRRLTPAECATLQDFPEVIPHLDAVTRRAAYRAIGNGVPPTLAEVVLRAAVKE